MALRLVRVRFFGSQEALPKLEICSDAGFHFWQHD